MRFASALMLLAVLVACAGTAFADKYDATEKPWEYTVYAPPRAIVPEAEPNDACPGQAINCGDAVEPAAINPGGDLDWYSFAANAGDVLTIGTDAYNGSSIDTYLELYFNCGSTMIAYDDDSGPNLFSLISNFTAPSTGTYTVKARGYSASVVGDYRLFVTCVPGQPPPDNDVCSGAIPIERCTQGSLSGDLQPYTNNYDPGSSGCTGYAAAGKDAVYVLNLQQYDVVNFSYTQLSADASFYLVTDCSNVTGSCVAGADDTVTGQAEVITYTVTNPGTYYLILDCYGTNTGAAWTLNYTITCPGPPLGACCVGEECTVTLQQDCQGVWKGAGTDCDPNPCIVVPVEQTSWGQIKSAYR